LGRESIVAESQKHSSHSLLGGTALGQPSFPRMAGQKEGTYASLEPPDVDLQNPNQGLTLYPKIPPNDLHRPCCPRKIAPECVPQNSSLLWGEPSGSRSSPRYASPEDSQSFEELLAKRRRIKGEVYSGSSLYGAQSYTNEFMQLSLSPAYLHYTQDGEAYDESNHSNVGGAQESGKEILPDNNIVIKVKSKRPYHYNTPSSKHPGTTCTPSVRENPKDVSKSQYTAPSGNAVGGSRGLGRRSRGCDASESTVGKVDDSINNTEIGNSAASKSKNSISIEQSYSCNRVTPMQITITECAGLQKDTHKVETDKTGIREPMSFNINSSRFGSPTTKLYRPPLTPNPIPNYPQPQDKPQDQGKPSQNLAQTSQTALWTVITSCLTKPVQDEASNIDDPTSISAPSEIPPRLRQLLDSVVNKFRTDANFRKLTVAYFMEQFAGKFCFVLDSIGMSLIVMLEQFQHHQEIATMDTNVQTTSTNALKDTFQDSDSSDGIEGENNEDPFTHDRLNGDSVDGIKKKYRLLERRFSNCQKKMQTLKSQVKYYKKAAKLVSLIGYNGPPSTATWACGNLLPSGKACGKKNPHYKGEFTWRVNAACKSCGSSPGKDPISPTGIPLERLTTFRVHDKEISQTKEYPIPPRANGAPVYGLDTTKNEQMSVPQRPLQMNTAAMMALNALYEPPRQGPLPRPAYKSPYGSLQNTLTPGPPYSIPHETPPHAPPQSLQESTSTYPCHNPISNSTHIYLDTLHRASTSCPVQSGKVSGTSPSPSKKRRLKVTETFGTRPGSLTPPTLDQNCHATTSAPNTVLTPLPSSSPSPNLEPSSSPPKPKQKAVAKAPKQRGRPLTEDEIQNINKSLHTRSGLQKKPWQQEHTSVFSENGSDLGSLFEEPDEDARDVFKSLDLEFEAAFTAMDSTEPGDATVSMAGDYKPDWRLSGDDGLGGCLSGLFECEGCEGEGEEQEQEWADAGVIPT
jgi:hypothetical protein